MACRATAAGYSRAGSGCAAGRGSGLGYLMAALITIRTSSSHAVAAAGLTGEDRSTELILGTPVPFGLLLGLFVGNQRHSLQHLKFAAWGKTCKRVICSVADILCLVSVPLACTFALCVPRPINYIRRYINYITI